MGKLIEVVTLWQVRLAVVLVQVGRAGERAGERARRRASERGDVPGWVMITVMSAGIVAILTAVAGPELRQMLRNALNSVQ